jgi:hypothetical protein
MKAILLESGDQCWTVTQFGGFKLRDLGRKNQIRRIGSEFWTQFQFNSNQDMELAGFLVPFRVEPQPRLLFLKNRTMGQPAVKLQFQSNLNTEPN